MNSYKKGYRCGICLLLDKYNEGDEKLEKIIMNKSKNIALIAHDNMKVDLVNWAYKNKYVLKKSYFMWD